MLRIYDADYQTICLIAWFILVILVYIFRCVNSVSSPSAKTIQYDLSKRYLAVYIPEGSPMFMFQAPADFQS